MEISGIVNTGLLMSADLGIIKKLRELLVHVFMTELQVHHRGPPPDQNQHRREVFDLFLPLRDVMPGVARTNSKRRWILGHYLNGRFNQCQNISVILGAAAQASRTCTAAWRCTCPGRLFHLGTVMLSKLELLWQGLLMLILSQLRKPQGQSCTMPMQLLLPLLKKMQEEELPSMNSRSPSPCRSSV